MFLTILVDPILNLSQPTLLIHLRSSKSSSTNWIENKISWFKRKVRSNGGKIQNLWYIYWPVHILCHILHLCSCWIMFGTLFLQSHWANPRYPRTYDIDIYDIHDLSSIILCSKNIQVKKILCFALAQPFHGYFHPRPRNATGGIFTSCATRRGTGHERPALARCSEASFRV